MSVIHKGTTIKPNKLELLTAWLPGREWYRGGEPRLAKAGGFRLDDPDGEVGIEFMAVSDADGTVYHVPMTYRAAPLEGAEAGLIGTMEHGVLGARWVYDAAHDPVALERMGALLGGRAVPQAQSESDTPDPTVTASYDGRPPEVAVMPPVSVKDRPGWTDVVTGVGLVLRVVRVLGEGRAEGCVGEVVGEWTASGGAPVRGDYLLALMS